MELLSDSTRLDVEGPTGEEANPLAEGLEELRLPDPVVLIVFGASGDLAARKIIPALYQMHLGGQLHENLAVLGIARSDFSQQEFRDKVRTAVERFARSPVESASLWDGFVRHFHYLPGDYNDVSTYRRLAEALTDLDTQEGTSGRRLYYIATPPALYPIILEHLRDAGLSKPGDRSGWVRAVIEKPFGRDLATAQRLNRLAVSILGEEGVYRIDHYLGKETVQNILIFRFANGIFEPIWNRRYVDHVQITTAEAVGVEHRAGYYDHSGALRDMFQNHMLQLLCLVAMEPPATFDADGVRQEKVKVMRSIRQLQPDEVDTLAVRGQYGPGVSKGERVASYREEPGVPADSATESFVAAQLHVDNWRWAGVPFYLRTGKRLARRSTEISIQFRRAPHLLFKGIPDEMQPNALSMRIQPDEGITLGFGAKVPGPSQRIRTVQMDFRYGAFFSGDSPEAYERLLLEALLGDQMLFARGDWVELSWGLLAPILNQWQTNPPDFPNYEAGTWGPAQAFNLLRRDKREWRRP